MVDLTAECEIASKLVRDAVAEGDAAWLASPDALWPWLTLLEHVYGVDAEVLQQRAVKRATATLRGTERHVLALRMWRDGATYDEIARTLKYGDRSGARYAVTRAAALERDGTAGAPDERARLVHERQDQALLLREQQGLSYREIAARLGYKEFSGARKAVFLARRRREQEQAA